jgi:hypothetical protein
MSVELISLALVILIIIIPYPIGYFYYKRFYNDDNKNSLWRLTAYVQGLTIITSGVLILLVLFLTYLIIHGILSN